MSAAPPAHTKPWGQASPAGVDEPAAQYPVVVANILATALDALEPLLAARTAPGGLIAMSGILEGQEDELLLRYAPHFTELRVDRREDWVRIAGRRKP